MNRVCTLTRERACVSSQCMVFVINTDTAPLPLSVVSNNGMHAFVRHIGGIPGGGIPGGGIPGGGIPGGGIPGGGIPGGGPMPESQSATSEATASQPGRRLAQRGVWGGAPGGGAPPPAGGGGIPGGAPPIAAGAGLPVQRQVSAQARTKARRRLA